MIVILIVVELDFVFYSSSEFMIDSCNAKLAVAGTRDYSTAMPRTYVVHNQLWAHFLQIEIVTLLSIRPAEVPLRLFPLRRLAKLGGIVLIFEETQNGSHTTWTKTMWRVADCKSRQRSCF